MVFQADTAFALILIALGIGFWVLVKARSQEAGNLRGFGTILGYFIIVLSFLVLLCAGYYSVRYWADGYFTKPATMGAMMGSMSIHGGAAGMMSRSCMHSERQGMMKGTMHDDCPSMKGDWKYCPYCGKEMKAGKKPSEMHDKMEGIMDKGHEMDHEEGDD